MPRRSAAVRTASSKIEVYPSGELAKERESIDGLSNGVLDFTIQVAAFLETLFPRFQIFDLPFLVRDLAAGYRILDGPVGTDLFGDLAAKGIQGLAWGVNGLREIETTKAIVVPDDMKGLRIRNVGGPINAATYQALGAIPVAIDFSETFTALAQHTVDAVDFPLDGFTTNKWYNVVKHVSMSNHIFSVAPLLGSKRRIESLPPPLQRIIQEEAKALIPTWRSLFAKHLADNMVVLKNNGVTFTEIQYPAFRKAVEPVYALVQAKVGADLLERVKQTGGV